VVGGLVCGGGWWGGGGVGEWPAPGDWPTS